MTSAKEPAMQASDAVTRWQQFCDGISQAGAEILATADGQDETTLAEGLRYLTRLLRSGIERHVEYWDPLDPFMADTYNERLRWGLDNPDSIYLMSAVDGQHEYVLTGNIGTVPYLNLTSAVTGTDARHTQTGFLDGADIRTDDDGGFTVHIGGAPRPQNWLRLAPDSNSVMLRQTFHLRSAERPVSCRIRRIADGAPQHALTAAAITARLAGAQHFVRRTGRAFLHLATLMQEGTNRLPPVSEALMQAMGGDPNYIYYWSAYRLQPGQALLLQLPEVPPCENWGLCLYDHWLASLDYSRATINLNKYTAAANQDGSVTIVVSQQRPAGGNWLHVQDHLAGNMMFRWTAAARNVAPLTRLVDLAEVDWPATLCRWAA